MTVISLKRAYEPQLNTDGFRAYIDRLWPRGLSHATFHYDLWDKETAPSTELREWFHADPAGRWNEFARRYSAELRSNPGFATLAGELMKHTKATLLYSSHDATHNNAIILRNALIERYPQKFSAG